MRRAFRVAHRRQQFLEHHAGRRHIQVAGRFVGQQHSGPLARARAIATRWRSPPESLPGRCSARAPRPNAASTPAPAPPLHARRASDHLRQHHVLQRGEFRQQMMELVNKADGVAPDRGARGIRQRAGVAAGNQDRPAIRPVEQPGDVQQRRFAGTRRRDQRNDLAAMQCQIDSAQHWQRTRLAAIGPLHALQPQRVVHAATHPPARSRLFMPRQAAGSAPLVHAATTPPVRRSLMPQRLHRIGARGPPARIQCCQQRETSPSTTTRTTSPQSIAIGQGGEFEHRGIEHFATADLLDRVLDGDDVAAENDAERVPMNVPVTPTNAPHIRKIRSTAPTLAPRCAAPRCRRACPSPA